MPYEFRCYYTKNKYGNESRLLFTYTDILMYEIKTEDAYEDFIKIKKCFVDGSSEHKEAKGVNRNVGTKTSHSNSKNVLLSNKCLKHSMNRIQRKKIKLEPRK